MSKLSLVESKSSAQQSAQQSDEQREALLGPPPTHFRKLQRGAWCDLIAGAKKEALTKENRFTFEIAATLMAKFRSGASMSATETKELKKHLVTLGLAKDDGGSPRKPRKNAKYFTPPQD